MASVEPARALVEITEFVDTIPALREFIDTVDPTAAPAVLAKNAASADPCWRELNRRIHRYIDSYGYRCLDELKLEAPDLRDDPAGIFHLLRMARASETQREVRDSAQDYLDAHLRGLRRRLFDALRGKIQRAATYREHLRFCRTRGFAIIKSLAAVMGRDLEQRGILDNRSDIFHLRLDELFEVYDGTMSGPWRRPPSPAGSSSTSVTGTFRRPRASSPGDRATHPRNCRRPAGEPPPNPPARTSARC